MVARCRVADHLLGMDWNIYICRETANVSSVSEHFKKWIVSPMDNNGDARIGSFQTDWSASWTETRSSFSRRTSAYVTTLFLSTTGGHSVIPY